MSHSPWLESRTRAVTVVALLGLCGLLVGGCASTAIQAQWADPQFAGRSLGISFAIFRPWGYPT
jgi:xanthosine utilization system XapX-like protein